MRFSSTATTSTSRIVERNFRFEIALGTAGNFFSRGKPFLDQRWGLPGRIEHSNHPIPIQLHLENPIRRVERLLCDFRHHRGNKGWEAFLWHMEKSQRKAIMLAVNIRNSHGIRCW